MKKNMSKKALLLRSTWEQEKPEFYKKIRDEKDIQIINALAELCAEEMSMEEIQKLTNI